MKIIKQEKEGNSFKFELEYDYDLFVKEKAIAIDEYSKGVKIPGFRPGKAPKNLVEKAIDSALLDDRALQSVISQSYPDLLKETKIDPVDYPVVDIIKFEEGKPISISLKVETYPEVKLGKYKGLKIKKKTDQVTDEDVQKVLGDLQNRFAKHLDITDGVTQKEDIVDLEIGAQAEGAEIKRWPRDLNHFPISYGYISPEFDDQIIGLKPGEEKSFDINFASDYSVKEIAGKKVTFKVKIKKISRKDIQPLDDSFASIVSSFGSLAELKEEIKKSLSQEKKAEAEADIKNQAIEAALKDTQIDLPEALLRTETDLILEDLKTSLAQSNLTLENYLKSTKRTEEELRTSVKPQAEIRAKGKIVLKKVSELENITVQPHDLDTEIALIAKNSNQSVDDYKKTLGQAGVKYLTDYLLRSKALDFLVNNAEIESQ